MKSASGQPRTMTVARRALIVQRVLVDGWTSAEAATVFGISERRVDIWVADFRRSGMRSLRRPPSRTAQIVPLTVLRPVRGLALRIASLFRRRLWRERLPEPMPLQRFYDDRRSRE